MSNYLGNIRLITAYSLSCNDFIMPFMPMIMRKPSSVCLFILHEGRYVS